jgi:hypothetical protein
MARKQAQDELANLIRAANEQLRIAKALSSSLDHRQREGMREAKKRKEAWQPDDAWRADFEKVNRCIVEVGGALDKVMKSERERLSGMTLEQLEAQFRQELIRAAPTFSAEEWAALDQVRMRAVLRGASA